MPAAPNPSPASAPAGSNAEALLKEIRSMSSDELIVQLVMHGVKPGPITGTTRSLFEKKLLRILTGEPLEDKAKEECPSSASESSGSEAPNKDVMFYGVQIPIEARGNESSLVFEDKKKALRVVKSYPGSRFKAFTHLKEAKYFSQQNPEQVPSPRPTKSDSTKVVSEGSAFRGPKTQELVRLRKAIEAGDKDTVLSIVWSNPRYLISSGDTPTVLQEGFRYNALHVCAQKNQAEICEALIDTLQDQKFMALLYPDEILETRQSRIHFLTDLYLNTPDKGNNETPLHFACKFAFPDVVKVLLAHPKTDRERKNRYNETAAAIVCSRARNPSQELKDKILQLMEEQCYVPLLRSDEEWQVAQEPWSPEKLREANTSPTHTAPTNSPLKVKAVAGPMSPGLARQFRKTWVTPPSPKYTDRRRAVAEIRRSDYEKGLERIGRSLAKEMNISWAEYWAFLDTFVDLSTTEGLKKLEAYLKEQAQRLESPVLNLEQQFAQLNLSDSGEDSGIEYREQVTPPQVKRTPTKQTETHHLAQVTIRLYMEKPAQNPPQGLRNDQHSAPILWPRKDNTTAGSLPTRRSLSPSMKEGDSFGPTSDSADTTILGDSSGSETPVVSSPCGKGEPESAEIAVKNVPKCTDLSQAVNMGEVRKALEPVDEMSDKTSDMSDKASDKMSENMSDKMSDKWSDKASDKMSDKWSDKASDKMSDKWSDKASDRMSDKWSDKTSERFTDDTDTASIPTARLRRLSASSQASSTSDFSTSSFYTCYDDFFEDLSSDEEDYKDFEETDIEDFKDMLPWSHKYYINGPEPTKIDVDVLRAIETVPVSPDDYPHVSKWRDALLCFSEEDRNRLHTPKRDGSRLTPQRSSSTKQLTTPQSGRQLTTPQSGRQFTTPQSAKKLTTPLSAKKDLYQSFLQAESS